MSQPPNTTSSRLASGTKSLMCGERPSVRLPSRTVPICVSDPIGLARPRRIASTPAIVVVLTAPIPTSRTPSFPLASAIFGGFFITGTYSSGRSLTPSFQLPREISRTVWVEAALQSSEIPNCRNPRKGHAARDLPIFSRPRRDPVRGCEHSARHRAGWSRPGREAISSPSSRPAAHRQVCCLHGDSGQSWVTGSANGRCL